MQQEAIRFTRDNASDIAEMIDYTAQELLDEYKHLLDSNMNLVLARDILTSESVFLSYVVSESVFYANARTESPLNDTTFVKVIQL